jgi:lecithin-cholesterol acyltransferase
MSHKYRETSIAIAILILLVFSALPAAAQAAPNQRPTNPLTPVVLFPGWGATRLQVTVHNQTIAPECPRSGTFEYTLFPADSGAEFSQVCMDKLLTLVYHSGLPKSGALGVGPGWWITEQPGVRVDIADYGKTESGPLMEPFYAMLEQAGYQRNVDIRVAGYDFRLTPDMGGFMARTTALIEETYRQNGNTPVHLVAHSNGPLYTQYLLTHVSQQWKNKYIHGFTPVAGNFPGQGAAYQWLFNGFNVRSVSFPADPANAASSAAMYASHPSTYMSASDPLYFGNREVVIRVGPGGKEYTPRDAMRLFKDAKLDLAQKIGPYYLGFVKFLPPFFPYVDSYAEKGSGLETIVGVELPSLEVGQVLGDAPVWITRDGDSNEEDITNDAVRIWRFMPCYRFEFHDNPGIDHVSLLSNPAVVERLVAHLQQPRSECRLK